MPARRRMGRSARGQVASHAFSESRQRRGVQYGSPSSSSKRSSCSSWHEHSDFGFSEFVVVAQNLAEVLAVEGGGQAIEQFGDIHRGLVAEFVAHEVREVHRRAPRRRARGARR